MDALTRAPDIATRRLALRRPERRDAARVAELCSDYDICSMSARMPYPYGLKDAEAFVAQVERQDRSRDNTFLVESPGEGVVGCVGFFRTGPAPVEMGYWIGRPYWGRGYATEAACAALDWARTAWGRRCVIAGHFDDNPRSAQVLIKTGFLYTGEVLLRRSRARRAEARTRMMVWLA